MAQTVTTARLLKPDRASVGVIRPVKASLISTIRATMSTCSRSVKERNRNGDDGQCESDFGCHWSAGGASCLTTSTERKACSTICRVTLPISHSFSRPAAPDAPMAVRS